MPSALIIWPFFHPRVTHIIVVKHGLLVASGGYCNSDGLEVVPRLLGGVVAVVVVHDHANADDVVDDGLIVVLHPSFFEA